VAEDFNIRLNVDLSGARADIAEFKKMSADSVKSVNASLGRLVSLKDAFDASASIGEINKLTKKINKLKEAAGEVALKVDSETSLAKVVESALKPSKSKGASATQIKQLQKQLSDVISGPTSIVSDAQGALESMRKVVSDLSRPNQKSAREVVSLRRELDALRKEFVSLNSSVRAGTATPTQATRATQLQSIIPKAQAKLAEAVSASKPSGDMKRMLDQAQRSIVQGTSNLQDILSELVSFADMLDETSTGVIQGAGSDLLARKPVRSMGRTKETVNIKDDAAARRAAGQEIAMSFLEKAGKGLNVWSKSSKGDAAHAGVMPALVVRALEQVTAGQIGREQFKSMVEQQGGIAVVLKGAVESLDAGIKNQLDPEDLKKVLESIGESSPDDDSEEVDLRRSLDLLEEITDNLQKAAEATDEYQASEGKVKKDRDISKIASKGLELSFTSLNGDTDQAIAQKEFNAFITRLIKSVSFGDRGGARIGMSYDQETEMNVGGFKTRDMMEGFFPVRAEELKEGFKFAAVSADKFLEAFILASEAASQLDAMRKSSADKAGYMPILPPTSKVGLWQENGGGSLGDNKWKPIGASSEDMVYAAAREDAKALIKEGSETFDRQKFVEKFSQVLGDNPLTDALVSMVAISTNAELSPIGKVAPVTDQLMSVFEKLTATGQNLIGLFEMYAEATGAVKPTKRNTGNVFDDWGALGLSDPTTDYGPLVKLFSAANLDPKRSVTVPGSPEEVYARGTKIEMRRPEGEKREYSFSSRELDGVGGVVKGPIYTKIYQTAQELAQQFFAIYGVEMKKAMTKNVLVNTATYRPGPGFFDDGSPAPMEEMNYIKAFTMNRSGMLEDMQKGMGRRKISDITTALPDIESALVDLSTVGKNSLLGATVKDIKYIKSVFDEAQQPTMLFSGPRSGEVEKPYSTMLREKWGGIPAKTEFSSKVDQHSADVIAKAIREASRQNPGIAQQEIGGRFYTGAARPGRRTRRVSDAIPEASGSLDAAGVYGQYLKAAKMTTQGLVNGLGAGEQAVSQASSKLGKAAIEGYEEETGIQSPSKEMYIRGNYTVEGLLNALKNGEAKLTKAGKALAKSFHQGFSEEEKLNAVARVQQLEDQGLSKPAAALRASMSTAPQRTAASETRPSTKQEIAERNKESERLIRELARTADAIIAWDVESSQEGGVFGYGMVGGTGAGDIRGIGHNMVVPPNFKLNRHEGEVLGLKSVEDLKKRIAAAGYDVERNTDPQAQRNMIEDIMHLIQVAIDANVPIAMHNIGFSDFNSLQKMAKQYGISGAPARQARDKGLLIETQALGTMLGMNIGPDGKPVSMKNEDVYQRLTGQAFGPQLIPGSGVVRQYKGKDAVAHDPTIDAAGTLVVATEQYKRIKGTTQKVVGFLGNLIDTTTATVQDISGILFGWKNKTGKKTDGVALSYKGFDNSYTGDRPEPREQKRTRRSAAKAMAEAQQDANKAARLASEFDRLTKEERKLQIEQRLDVIEGLRATLKALHFRPGRDNNEKSLAKIAYIQKQIDEAMADPTVSQAWYARLNATGGVRSGFGGGGSGNQPPVSGSVFDQNMEAEAKARAVASKKIQGQMKDEMSVMAQVERHNRKMMDSWISGRYALYDMANTYQQFTRAGMRMATYLRQAVMLNAQYETSFTGVERVMQPLNDEIAGMRKELTKLTTEIPVAFDELSRISTLAGQMGINASAITEFTKEVSQFGTVTGIATDEVAAKFGSIAQLTHTATDPEGFKKLGSAVAYTGINAVATDQEILSLTESIASATTQAGFAADQTIGLATAMSSLRIAPEQARGVITRLFGDIDRAVQGGGQPMQAYAKHLGMTAEKAKELWEADPQAFFTKMLENVKNSKNSTMALDALNIKETREVNTIQKLSENLDVYNSSMADAAEAYKNGTFLAEAYGKSQDNVATKITLLSNQFKLFQDALGEALGPFTEKALEIVTGVLDGLTKISENPVGSFAVKAATALSAMFATFVAGTMLTNKATASMLAFRTANLALAKMGGGESGIWGFIRQITGQEVLLARSNGRVEVLTRKRRKQLEALGEIQVVKKGSQAEQTILSNIAAERGQMASTEDIIAQKGAYVKATLDETNQDRISTLQKENNTKARIRKALGLKAETAATVTATSAEMADARANMASTAAIEAEIVIRQRKIAALAAENVQLQASIGISSRDVAATQAQIAANNAETVSIEAQIAALQARNATSTKGPEQVAVIGKDRASGFGGIVGKIGAIGAVASVLVGIFAGISEAIESTKVNLEEAGGGLASFREAIYADTRAWQESGQAFSTYDSKVTTSKETLNGWATDLQKATGATGELGDGMTDTTEEIDKQTLALSENSAAWLANAAMADTNVQDMFKKFYTVSGPGLGDMAAAAGTKISDIIKAALTEPGTGALAYVEKNFNMFAASLEGKGSQVKEALIKIAESLDSTTAAGVENSKMVKALNEGFKETGDEAGDLSSNINQVAERVRTLTDYTGDLSSIMSSAFTIRYGKTEAIDKLTGAWQQLRDKIKQAREEIANIQRDINGMQADANILKYQLDIAIKYGDTKRADKLRADLAAKEQEISDKNAQMVKAQGEASTSLVGNTQAAIDNRATLRGLVQDYNAYLAALANTAQYEGLSDKEVKRKKDFLKAQADQAKKDLISLAAGLGFKENELAPYVKSIDDFKTIVDKLPKELTLKVVADPAARAFMEWWAQNKGNFDPTNGATDNGAVDKKTPAKPVAPPAEKKLKDLPTKIAPATSAERSAVASADESAMSSARKKSAETLFQSARVFNNSFAGVDTRSKATAKFKNDRAKMQQWEDAFAKLTKAERSASDWGLDVREIKDQALVASEQGGSKFNWFESMVEESNIGATESGKKTVSLAVSKLPKVLQEAIAYLKTSPKAFMSDIPAYRTQHNEYMDMRAKAGIPEDWTWSDIVSAKRGVKQTIDGKKQDVVAYIKPSFVTYWDYLTKMKEKAAIANRYRELLLQSYTTTQLKNIVPAGNLKKTVIKGRWPDNGADMYASGGYVQGPGTSRSDSIPAMLSNGEFVMQASAVKAYGPAFMNALNQQQVMPRYALAAATSQQSGAQVVYLSPEDRNLLRAAIDRPVNLYTDNARIAQSANAGNVLLAQRGRN
jgi:TP901 family phage tail tape measure protein